MLPVFNRVLCSRQRNRLLSREVICQVNERWYQLGVFLLQETGNADLEGSNNKGIYYFTEELLR